jgi:hypothetical protein
MLFVACAANIFCIDLAKGITNFLTVNTTRTSTQFGQVTAFRDPRLIQFGLKFYF